MGQGVIKDVAASLTDTFAHNLADMVERGGAAAAAAPAAPAAPSAATPAPPPPPAQEPQEPEPAAAPEAALPAGAVVRAVVAGRLRDPRALAGLAVLVAAMAFLLGRRSAR
jgi:hypothetical protein